MKMEHKIKNKTARKIISKIYYKLKPKDRKFLLEFLPKNAICAEIGVFKGEFSKQILKITKPNKLYLIDTWTYDEPNHGVYFEENLNQEFFDKLYSYVKKTFEKKSNVIIKKGDSVNVLKTFNDSFFDWIYIDGNHEYSAVKLDLELSFQKVKPEGFIIGDDYVKSSKLNDGVIRAVNEFVDAFPVELITVQKFQFIIRKK